MTLRIKIHKIDLMMMMMMMMIPFPSLQSLQLHLAKRLWSWIRMWWWQLFIEALKLRCIFLRHAPRIRPVSVSCKLGRPIRVFTGWNVYPQNVEDFEDTIWKCCLEATTMNFQVYETPMIYVFTLLIVLFSWLQLQIKYVCWNDTF